MHRFACLRPWALTLLSVMLLMGRIQGTHLHLCFDGQESPTSVHTVEFDLHHDDAGAQGVHHDADIALFGDLIGKSRWLSLDQPLALTGPFVVPADAGIAHSQPVTSATPSFTAVRLLGSPPRGPPSPSLT